MKKWSSYRTDGQANDKALQNPHIHLIAAKVCSRKPLHTPPTVCEPLDDLVVRTLFHWQTINDSDHTEPLVL
jgi:hypothetical protein